MIPDWKELVRILTDLHEAYGSSVVLFSGEIPDPHFPDPVLLTPDENLYREAGALLTQKKVRGWLWNHRKAEWSEPADNIALFSAIDPDTQESVVGIAAFEEFTDEDA